MSGLADEVARYSWYHTIELPEGIITPGLFDTRSAAAKIPLPESLSGKRCLDVGTADGFWAFEMEKRGASEVIAIDLVDPSERDITVGAVTQKPLPAGEIARRVRTFDIAHRALGSKVDMRNMSVYDLSHTEVGEFDFVFMGSILVHLRDPVLALSKVRSVTRGELMSYEAVSPSLSLLKPWTPAATLSGIRRSDWWIPNLAALRRMIQAGGFEIVAAGGISFVRRPGAGRLRKQFLRHPLATTLLRVAGIAQSWVRARPAPMP